MPESSPRVTLQVLRVLNAMLVSREEQYGFQLSKLTGLKSGTLYPILARLESAGWVTSGWEDQAMENAGRPRRRYYRLTGIGSEAARLHLSEMPRQTSKAGRGVAHPALGGAW